MNYSNDVDSLPRSQSAGHYEEERIINDEDFDFSFDDQDEVNQYFNPMITTSHSLDEIEPLLKEELCKITHDPEIFNYLRLKPLINSSKRPMMNFADNLLHIFTHNSKPYPKIEDFKLCIIRLFKKMIRSIIQKKIDKFFPPLNSINREQVRSFLIIEEIIKNYLDLLSDFSNTKSGPQTEGKRRLYKSTIDSSVTNQDCSIRESKTFNNSCVKTIFQNDIIRGLYKAFIDYLFEVDRVDLIKIFKFRCCSAKNHRSCFCSTKWERLKEFCLTTLVGCEFIHE